MKWALALLLFFGLALADEVKVYAAGDIAYCNLAGDEATARLIQELAPKDAPWWVLALGDLAYPKGSREEFERCYHPSWGAFFTRTYPVPGNHEYYTKDAAGYYGYFGPGAHPPGGYYRFELAGWTLYALNSNCHAAGCEKGSRQYRWLKEELARDPNACQLAFMHHPRYSSGVHGESKKVDPLWRLLVAAGVELVLAGHDHHYERLLPVPGTRLFVVGTGGAPLRKLKNLAAGSERAVVGEWGVLELTLFSGGYRFRFINTRGEVLDEGEGRCG